MQIGGVSVVAFLGVINFLLVAFQLVTGLHLINVGIRTHKKSGFVLCITAFIHGLLAFIENM